VKHEEFAERVGRRLEAVADRLEGEGRRLGIDGEAQRSRRGPRSLGWQHCWCARRRRP
jgi:hypothetical protein